MTTIQYLVISFFIIYESLFASDIQMQNISTRHSVANQAVLTTSTPYPYISTRDSALYLDIMKKELQDKLGDLFVVQYAIPENTRLAIDE